jgi:hypothetical protein
VEILTLNYYGSDCGSKKCKEGYGSASGIVWWSLFLAGVWSLELGCQFLVGTLAGVWFSGGKGVFTFSLLTKDFYKSYLFNAIRNNKAVINCIYVQDRNKCSFPSTLTGNTKPVFK